MYDTTQQVSLTSDDLAAKIYDTTDGNTPTKNSTPYTGAISVSKTTAIRAISYHDGYLPSNVMCWTYLISEHIKLPVISIVTDPNPMFNPVTGLYEMGLGAKTAFTYLGANFWSKTALPAHLELLEPDGTVGISQDIGLRLFGQYSRGEKLKGFSFTARSKYRNNSFNYAIFPDLPFTSYKSFISRPSGQDVNRSRIRDVLITSLVHDTTSSMLDVQDYRNAVEFINGQFWGVTQIREKITTHWIAQHYKLDATKIDLLDGNGKVKNGSNQDYKDLVNYVKSHDLAVETNYDYVASKMDIESYIDWYACEICSGNSDLGNIRFWKSQGPGGKWKWIFFDFCWAFNTLNRPDIQYDLNPSGNGANHDFSTALINGLLKNSVFKEKFLERLAYHITVTFEPTRVLARINEIAGEIEPYGQRF